MAADIKQKLIKLFKDVGKGELADAIKLVQDKNVVFPTDKNNIENSCDRAILIAGHVLNNHAEALFKDPKQIAAKKKSMDEFTNKLSELQVELGQKTSNKPRK